MADRRAAKILPKKYLGQHFLVDKKVIDRMTAAIDPASEDCVFEIGPGTGALTEAVAGRAGRYIGVETDGDLCRQLRQSLGEQLSEPVAESPESDARYTLVHQDFLEFDFRNLVRGMKLVGNLPYNISTPILEKIITARSYFKEAFFTVQLEFGQRLAARVGTKDYGSLSCFLQYYADVRVLFRIPAQAFSPQPRVTSCFVHVGFRPPVCPADNEELLFRLIRQAFGQRRKMISNSLASLFPQDTLSAAFQSAGLDPSLRAEDLTIKNYADLANAMAEAGA